MALKAADKRTKTTVSPRDSDVGDLRLAVHQMVGDCNKRTQIPCDEVMDFALDIKATVVGLPGEPSPAEAEILVLCDKLLAAIGPLERVPADVVGNAALDISNCVAGL